MMIKLITVLHNYGEMGHKTHTKKTIMQFTEKQPSNINNTENDMTKQT